MGDITFRPLLFFEKVLYGVKAGDLQPRLRYTLKTSILVSACHKQIAK